MSVNLARRVAALEGAISADGQIVTFWAMDENCEPMTEQEIERGIVALRAKGAPANARFIPIQWQSPCDPN